MSHFDSCFSKDVAFDNAIVIGQVWRNQLEAEGAWAIDRQREVALFISGTVVSSAETTKRLRANDILEHYIQHGSVPFQDYDGAFTFVLVDQPRGLALIANDRLGTLPLYYLSNKDTFCFAPEVKAIFAAMGSEARLSRSGIITFLANGYCLGSTTLFDGVKMLEPGTVLTVHLDSLGIECNRYWKMVYEQLAELRSRRAAEASLYEAVRAGHRAVLCDGVRNFDILLSGGLDSRAVLAVLCEMGHPPRRAFGWGLRQDIPYSDPYLAAELAREFGVKFDFIAYDTDQFLENAQSWCYLSELANDNIGWYGEGASVLAAHYKTRADFALVGDECWGWGGCVNNEKEAIAAVLPAQFPPSMQSSFQSAIRDECAAVYSQEIQQVLKCCDNDSWADRKDFLYLHGRVARFIFSLGYYKELAIEIRRPFLTAPVLELVRHLPAQFRYHKNLYESMLWRYLPRAMDVPTRAANSLPDWQYDIRTKPLLRTLFSGLLDTKRLEGGPLSEFLDLPAFCRIRDDFFQRPPSRLVRQRRRTRRMLGHLVPRYIKQFRKSRGVGIGGTGARGPFDFLRSVALLSLLQDQLSRFSGDNDDNAATAESPPILRTPH